MPAPTEGGAQIGYAGAHVRASGTFSFVVGPGNYGPMVAVFILYGLVKEKFARQWLLWAAAFAVVLSVPLTGSRTFVVELAAVVACTGVAAAFGISQFLKSLKIVLPLFVVFAVASFLPVFSESSKNLNERIEGGNMIEGGGSFRGAIAHRTVNPLLFNNHPDGFRRAIRSEWEWVAERPRLRGCCAAGRSSSPAKAITTA